MVNAAEVQFPATLPDWKIELLAEAPKVKHPSVVCSAPDGRVFVAEDPMDITAPANAALGRIVCFHPDGRTTVFADQLHAVFGMQYLEGKLYVLHNPRFSVFNAAEEVGTDRLDLIEQTNPNPWAQDWNDHVPANFRLGMDGFFYVAVGDKGIYGAVGRDGRRVDMRGGGILRLRPDGTALEVFCTGVRNILDVAMNEEDEFFTYDNTDEQQWMGRVTHMVDGGFYGYPHDFIPQRPYTLWMLADYGAGAATGTLCVTDDTLPAEYRGNLFLADFGKRQIQRVRLARYGATYRALEKIDLFPDPPPDFRPVGIGWSADGAGIYICDWQHRDVKGQAEVGRLWKLSFTGPTAPAPRPNWFLPASTGKPFEVTSSELIAALAHPAHSVRLTAQRRLADRAAPGTSGSARGRSSPIPIGLATLLADRAAPAPARWHALWALDAIDGGQSARREIVAAAGDPDPGVRRQALRQLGTRRSGAGFKEVAATLKDPDASVRFHAATALGRMGDPAAIPLLISALKEDDLFARYAVFTALNRIGRAKSGAWAGITRGLESSDAGIREGTGFALRETYDPALVEALARIVLGRTLNDDTRAAAARLLAAIARMIPEWKGEWWSYHPVNAPPPEKTRDWPGTARVLECLRTSIEDPSAAVRLAALEGIREARDLASASQLRSRFGRETDAALRRMLVSVLGVLRDAGSQPLLVGVMERESDEALLEEAFRAAGRITGVELGAATLRFLQGATGSTAVVRQALEAVGSLKPENAGAVLTRYATNSVAEVRTAALDSLVAIQRGAAMASLVPLLEQPALEVRRSVVVALGKTGSPAALPKLLEAFGNPDTRAEAILSLARLPNVKAMEAYLAGMADDNPAVREACRKAVRAIGPEAITLLTPRVAELPAPVLAELRRAYDDNAEVRRLFEGAQRILEPDEYLEFALKNAGDAAGGRRVFFDTGGVACSKCHVIAGEGGRIGPDLSGVGAQFSRGELAESILFPSRAVREGYQAAIVELRGGDEISGLYKGETADEITLMDTEGRLRRIWKSDIADRRLGKLSLMPEGLHVALTPRQFADLVTFLESLKPTVRKP